MLRCSVVLSNKSTIINTTIFADNSKSNITYFIISSSWSLVMIDKQRKSGIDISHLTYVWRRSDGRKAVHRAIFWIIFVEKINQESCNSISYRTPKVYIKGDIILDKKNEVKYLLCSLRKFLCTSWQILVHTTPHTTKNHLIYM